MRARRLYDIGGSFRQERPQFRVSSRDSLPTKPWGIDSQPGVLQVRAYPACSSPSFLECGQRVESYPAVKPVLVVESSNAEASTKTVSRGFHRAGSISKYTNPLSPPLKMSRMVRSCAREPFDTFGSLSVVLQRFSEGTYCRECALQHYVRRRHSYEDRLASLRGHRPKHFSFTFL